MGRKQAKKAKAGKKMRIQVVIDKKIIDEVDDLAADLNMTRSYFLAMLLEETIADRKWLLRLLASKFLSPLRSVVQRLDGGKAKATKEEFERLDSTLLEDEEV